MLSKKSSLRAIGLAVAAMALAVGAQISCAQVEPTKIPCSSMLYKHTVTVDGYIFRTYLEDNPTNPTDDTTCLVVTRAGKVVFRKVEEGGEFSLGQAAQPDYGVPEIAPGTDVTGRGHPEMIASYYSGGAHCCTSILLFELEPKFQLLTTLEAGDNEMAHFEKSSKDGKFIFIRFDETFVYWHTSFAESPLPKVILKPASDEKGKLSFQLDLQRMKGRAPTDQEWTRVYLPLARRAFAPGAAFEDYYAGSALWGQMLDWIYQGEADWAWKLVDAVWPADKAGENEFLKDFCGQLKQSEFWPELQPQIGNPPPACLEGIAEAAAKPK
jgi:hypothetical protein